MLESIFKIKSFWIFDLDNTIYSPKSKVFDQIDKRMKKFISVKLNISQQKAYLIQKKFYKKYGTTLSGLMINYNVKPKEFLDYVHDVDLTKLKKCNKLFLKIKNLPGKKIIYTNGDSNYAKRVLTNLGINSLFDYILDIKKSNYVPKPSIEPLIKYLKKKKIEAKSCVYFEDLEKNLERAHKYGITTVHITNQNFKMNSIKPFVDYRFTSILNALEDISKRIS
jgi:putative hydrolase of the HAD superfamily|tara:strand:- start:1069 stop:1737 length:669 start_codon:yes stop_codon:yes gene_type:complete